LSKIGVIIINVIIIIIYHIFTSTPFGLKNSEFERRWGQEIFFFPRSSKPVPEAHPASCTKGTGRFFQGYSDWGDHPHPSNDKVKERVEPNPYSRSLPLWPVIGQPLSLPS
jgi:hypothetical protein